MHFCGIYAPFHQDQRPTALIALTVEEVWTDDEGFHDFLGVMSKICHRLQALATLYRVSNRTTEIIVAHYWKITYNAVNE